MNFFIYRKSESFENRTAFAEAEVSPMRSAVYVSSFFNTADVAIRVVFQSVV